MKITVKNLQQQTFTVDLQEEKTVRELKEAIYKERGEDEYEVKRQKLIYAGVILDDDRTVASYSIDEKKFVVVMLKRDVGGPAKKPEESKDSSSSSGGGDSKKETEPKIEHKSEEGSTKSSGSEGGAASGMSQIGDGNGSESSKASDSSGDLAGVLSNTSLQSRAESSLLMGEEYNRTVESMVEMGYSRELVERAMAASYNNPERAVEYLISGIPETDDGFNASSAAASESAVLQGRAGDTRNRADGAESRNISTSGPENAAADESARSDPFAFLRNQPQFLQMRSLVYQNPDLLQAVLQQIGQTNPALLHLISENQEEFLSMLNQPLEGQQADLRDGRRLQMAARAAGLDIDSPNVRASAGDAAAADGNQGAGGSGDGGRVTLVDALLRDRAATAAAIAALTAAAMPASAREGGNNERDSPASGGETEGVATIRLTSQDQDAIERLKALGFPEALVLQAYFACDKDEQLAANFLISSAYDD